MRGRTARIVTIIRRGVSLFVGVSGTGGAAPRATIPHFGRDKWGLSEGAVMALSRRRIFEILIGLKKNLLQKERDNV